MNQFPLDLLDAQLAALFNRINYERQLKVTPRSFKLQNMREFLRRLGDPHLRCPIVHVAGTKGKGSVATMVGQILMTSGRRTGVYVSPHLETINQRMVLDGQTITDDQLLETLQAIEPVANEMDREANDDDRRKLTFFEVTTAAAFCFFANQQADAVVLEVGLGGRLDSTNVCHPLVTVITNISFDHTKQLGNTLALIAGEKAGIIKRNIPVVSGALAPEAAEVIARVAADNESQLVLLNRDFRVHHSVPGAPFSVTGTIGEHRFELDNLTLGLLGTHQQTNAGLAIAVAKQLNCSNWQISDNQIRSGLALAQLAGRTEIVARHPTVMVDIAHNPASVLALVATLAEVSEWKSSRRKILIMAASREKEAEAMLLPLLKIFDEIIFTKYQNNPRGRAAEELLQMAETIVAHEKIQTTAKFSIQSTPLEAWNAAVAISGESDFICIAGSAFLVAELRRIVCR